jgi:4-diphosphocytidyl-2-C-methyl-D-erythritol kinase
LHEVASVLQRIDVCDRLGLEPSVSVTVEGYSEDSLVRRALGALAQAAGIDAGWRVRLEKKIPVAAGLGGGSADAAAALVLANETLPAPLAGDALTELAAGLGADVPFFLRPGPKLAEGAGESLTELDLPQDYWVVLALPRGATKRSTGDVYARFDEVDGGRGFARRKETLLAALASCSRARDLAALPPNDLATFAGAARLLDELRVAGAFRSDQSGAGPAVYGLFQHRHDAHRAADRCRPEARVWVTVPVW